MRARVLGLFVLHAIACNPDSTAYEPDRVTMGLDLPAHLPVMLVDVGGRTIERDVEIPGTIVMIEKHDGTHTDLATAARSMTSPITFEGRGNFTWTLPKKGYSFELQDATGTDVERELLGLPAGSDFALYACYTDKTCLRSALVFAVAQELGTWSPRTRFVELYIDGTYRGLYMLFERIRRDKARVDIPKPATIEGAGDLTGGYIIRNEGPGNGNGEDFTLTSKRIYTYHYPNPTNLTPAQSAYVRGAFQRFEDALAASPAAYAEVIDEASWVDHGVIEELTNNWDGYVHSIYMTKQSDADGGRIGMGPPWDFDLAFGNGNVTGYNCRTDNWAHRNERAYPNDVPTYWRALYEEPQFQRAWKCRWQQLRTGPLALATFETRIATWVAYTAAARMRDQAAWPTIERAIFPNCSTEPTYDADVTWLRAWIEARLAWLDTRVAAFPGDCP